MTKTPLVFYEKDLDIDLSFVWEFSKSLFFCSWLVKVALFVRHSSPRIAFILGRREYTDTHSTEQHQITNKLLVALSMIFFLPRSLSLLLEHTLFFFVAKSLELSQRLTYWCCSASSGFHQWAGTPTSQSRVLPFTCPHTEWHRHGTGSLLLRCSPRTQGLTATATSKPAQLAAWSLHSTPTINQASPSH
jgi:hypothetical protein